MTPWQVRRDEMAIELENSIYRMEPWQEPPDFGVCFKHGFDAGRKDTLTEEQVIKDLVGALKSALYVGEIMFKSCALSSQVHNKITSSIAAYDKLIKGEANE